MSAERAGVTCAVTNRLASSRIRCSARAHLPPNTSEIRPREQVAWPGRRGLDQRRLETGSHAVDFRSAVEEGADWRSTEPALCGGWGEVVWVQHRPIW